MEHEDKVKAIQFIRPGAEFALKGEDLEWLDEVQVEPTEKEISDGLKAYKAAIENEAATKKAQKDALLERLGITEEEAQLLLA
jgi:hypothetical protein